MIELIRIPQLILNPEFYSDKTNFLATLELKQEKSAL